MTRGTGVLLGLKQIIIWKTPFAFHWGHLKCLGRKRVHPENSQDLTVFFPIFLRKMYRIVLPLYFCFFWLVSLFFMGVPLPSPHPLRWMPEAAAVALATLQHKLVAFGPSVPNLGYVVAVCFLFLFIIYQKPDFISDVTFMNSDMRANFSYPFQS